MISRNGINKISFSTFKRKFYLNVHFKSKVFRPSVTDSDVWKCRIRRGPSVKNFKYELYILYLRISVVSSATTTCNYISLTRFS
jgi:hypothetical protein